MESTLVDDTMPTPKAISNSYHDEASPTRMFGDTIQYRQSKQFRRLSRGEKPPKPGPPPQLPAPVPTPVVPNYSKPQGIPQSNSFSSSGGAPMVEKRKTPSATMNFNKPVGTSFSECICSKLKSFAFSNRATSRRFREMELPVPHCIAATIVDSPTNCSSNRSRNSTRMTKRCTAFRLGRCSVCFALGDLNWWMEVP